MIRSTQVIGKTLSIRFLSGLVIASGKSKSYDAEFEMGPLQVSVL